MEFLDVVFPVSGVRVPLYVPPLVAAAISFFSSMGGLSGAFLILPFQMSVLGYAAPSVSATNFVFNIVAIPSGVYRYVREGRMNWPLAWAIVLGTLPGVFAGYYVRVLYLPEHAKFKVFVGYVLLYLGVRMLLGLRHRAEAGPNGTGASEDRVSVVSRTLTRIDYTFRGQRFSFGTAPVFALSFAVGIIGGIYGIGGGAIIAPFLVSVLRLPVYTIAGATLMGTFLTSVVGVIFYSTLPSGLDTSPDWALGALFGAGGFVGLYFGARAQRHVPQRLIRGILALVLLALAMKYVLLG